MLKKIQALFLKKNILFWFLQTYTKRHLKILTLSFFLGAIFFLLLSKIGTKIITRFSIISTQAEKIAVVGNFSVANLPDFIQEEISLGLTKTLANAEIEPGLAYNWKVEDNGRKITFFLKENIFFHSRDKFTARDINYNFKDVAYLVVDNQTIIFFLKEPFAPFFSLVSQPIFKGKLDGVGDYQVNQLKLKKNFVSLISLISTKKKPTHKIYKFYPNEQMAVTAFKLGEVDIIQQIDDRSLIENLANATITSQTDRSFLALFFNNQDPLLNEKSIRQALVYALPEFPDEEKAISPIHPQSIYFNPEVKSYKQDIENALKLLKKTPLASQSAENKIKLKLSTFKPYLPFAEKIKEAWQVINFALEVKIVNELPGDFQVLLASQRIPLDPDQYFLWHSTQKTNISHYKNVKIDKLLEDGRKTIIADERISIYADFQQALSEDVPAALLYYPKVYRIERK